MTRAAILAQREAFIEGAKLIFGNLRRFWTPYDQTLAEREAARKYPIPTVKRPRVVRVTLPGRVWEFKVEGGVQFKRLVSGDGGYGQRAWHATSWTLHDLRALVSIFEEPIEEVEIP